MRKNRGWNEAQLTCREGDGGGTQTVCRLPLRTFSRAATLLQHLPSLLRTAASEAELEAAYSCRTQLGEAVLVHFQARRAAGSGPGAGNGHGNLARSLLRPRNVFFHASSSASTAAATASASAQPAQAALSATLTPSTLD